MPLVRTRVLALLTVATAAITTASAVGAQAYPGPGAITNGGITYLDGSTVYTAKADGTSVGILIGTGARGVPAWAPDGSRYVYEDSTGQLLSGRPDGTGLMHLTALGETGTAPAWSPWGAVFYSSGGQIKLVGADGGWWRGAVHTPPAGASDTDPTVSRFGVLIFTRTGGGQNGLYRNDLNSPVQPALIVAGASQASFAPDGTQVAYIKDGQVWVADEDGGNPAQLTHESTASASQPVWSPDGRTILFVRPGGVLGSVDPASGNVTTLAGNNKATDTAWMPVGQNHVERVWGQDHVDTAVAASQFNYETAGSPDDRVSAGAVVLSRDDTYLDALVGSAFAVKESAPLLITNRLALDSRVEREINRILGGRGTVYLLGGELALAPAVQSRLVQLGYQVERIWGQTHFDTAIAINRRMTGNPKYAIVTTGTNYYDALAAGAAAGANPTDTVIVLTDHDRMPAASAAYLNEMTPNGGGTNDPQQETWIVSAGGPGDSALLNAWNSDQLWPGKQGGLARYQLVGQNEMDTAVQIADFFFAAPSIAAVATNRAWFDALTGGAMIGFNGGPLLITNPNALYDPVRRYLSRNAGNIWDTVLLGGPAALPEGSQHPIGDAISLPGEWQYVDIQPQTAGPGVPTQSRETPTTQRTTTQVRPNPAGDHTGDLITVTR